MLAAAATASRLSALQQKGKRTVSQSEDHTAVASVVAVQHVFTHRHTQARVTRPNFLQRHTEQSDSSIPRADVLTTMRGDLQCRPFAFCWGWFRVAGIHVVPGVVDRAWPGGQCPPGI